MNNVRIVVRTSICFEKKKQKKPVNGLDLSSFRGTHNRTWWVPYRKTPVKILNDDIGQYGYVLPGRRTRP